MKPSNSRKILANNVFSLRYDRGWSQETLADKAKVSITYISDIENSKKNAGIDYLDEIAHAFGIRTFELLIDRGSIVAKKRIDSKK